VILEKALGMDSVVRFSLLLTSEDSLNESYYYWA
jgi:hypothetical protein